MTKLGLAVLGSAALLMTSVSANAASVRIRADDSTVVRVHGGDEMRHGHGWRRGHHDRWEGRHHRRHWRHGGWRQGGWRHDGWRHHDRDGGVKIIIGRDRGDRHHRDRDDEVEYRK